VNNDAGVIVFDDSHVREATLLIRYRFATSVGIRTLMSASLDKLIRIPYICIGYPTRDKTCTAPKDELVSTRIEPHNDIGMFSHAPRLVPGGVIFQFSVICPEPPRPLRPRRHLTPLTPCMRAIDHEKHACQCDTPNMSIGLGYISANHHLPLKSIKTSDTITYTQQSNKIIDLSIQLLQPGLLLLADFLYCYMPYISVRCFGIHTSISAV